MTNDPIVEEIHRHREEHAARFHHDLHAICEDFRQAQTASGRQVVTRPPRRPVISAPSSTTGQRIVEAVR